MKKAPGLGVEVRQVPRYVLVVVRPGCLKASWEAAWRVLGQNEGSVCCEKNGQVTVARNWLDYIVRKMSK
jgi:hypothetical protein